MKMKNIALVCLMTGLMVVDVACKKAGPASDLFFKGAEAYDNRDMPKAIQCWSQAIKICQQIQGTEPRQACCYQNIGLALDYMGKYEQAIAKYEQALKLCQQIEGAEREQAFCHQKIGVDRGNMYQHEQEIANYYQVLSIFEHIKGTEWEQAGCYSNIGAALGNMGQYGQGIAWLEQALKLYRQIKDKDTEWPQGRCYINIGVDLVYIGRHEESVAKQEQALKLFKQIKGTERDQAGCHGNIGEVLRIMGEYEQGMSRQEQALKLFEQIKGTELEQAVCSGNIGRGHLGMGQYSKAIASFVRAGRGWWTSRCLGQAYHLRGEPGDDQKAIQSLLDAIEWAERMRSSVLAFEHRAGIFEKPAEVFPDFVSLLIDLAEKNIKIQEPEVIRWSKNPNSSSALLESAFHFADQGKGRALEDALREKATLKATRPDARLLTQDKELSLQISKLTSLREQLPVMQVERKKELTRKINELQQQRNMLEVKLKSTALGDYVSPEFRKPMDMAEELTPGTAVLQYSVGEKEATLLILTRQGVTAHQLGVEAPALPELFSGQKASSSQLVKAWKERPEKIGLDGLVHLARMRAEDLSKRSQERHNLISGDQEKAILERLGEVVLPASALKVFERERIEHLLIIPDGSLHYVPFAMLRIPSGDVKENKFLLESYSLSYVPAMTTLETVRKQKQERVARRKIQRRCLLAFANPDFREGLVVNNTDDMVTRMRSFRNGYYQDAGLRLAVLPETEQEAVRAGSLFAPVQLYKSPTVETPEGQAVVCVSRAASEEQVKYIFTSPESQWQYLLFSTHGLADTHNGMLSCIALSSPSSTSEEDGFLQAQEVMDLELDSDLVMLSACQTGLGSMRGGEGLVGLCSAFFYAGTESVCASLWQVPSGPTSELVTEFFKHLKEGKLNRAEALRQAQLSVLRASRESQDDSIHYSDPFCWAAFVLNGEWQ